MLIKELLAERRPLLEGLQLEVYEALLPILLVNEDEGGDGGFEGDTPEVDPAPPPQQNTGMGGWGRGPFRPGGGMNGNYWFRELFNSLKSYAVATRMSARLKTLGIKGVGVDRVNKAKKNALKNTKNLLTNPFATAYKIPSWTTKNTMPKIAIKMWNEEFARQFANELSKVELVE